MAAPLDAALARAGRAEAVQRRHWSRPGTPPSKQARAEAGQQVHAAGADRDHALARAAEAEQATRLAQQEISRAQAAEHAARAETGRVRADAEKLLADFRADAVRDRDEMRADLRAAPDRAEPQAVAYPAELARLRPGPSHDTDTTASRTPRRTRQATQP